MGKVVELDDPSVPRFASWRSYSLFAYNVRTARRYVWTREIDAFLQTLLATTVKRLDKIPHGARFYRAQKGWASSDERGHHYPYGPDRMKPQERRASEGRANSVGIPVLYLATSPETAVSETRPWVGAEVSVGTFEVTRDLTIVNFTHEGPTGAFRKLGLDGIFGERKLSTEQITDAVLADIDDAFSRPVSREDSSAADYAPTQILTELLKDAGYDGIAYNSHFKGGHNVALFDVEAARLRVCAPYEVKEIQIAIKQVDADAHYED